jgi:hypothetical protein
MSKKDKFKKAVQDFMKNSPLDDIPITFEKIDRNRPLFRNDLFDYIELSSSIHKYFTQYFHKTINDNIREIESSIETYVWLKTEDYFDNLWKDVSKIGFEKENYSYIIDGCTTLIEREIDWWKDRELESYKAEKLPSLVKYYSYKYLLAECDYNKHKGHPLHNHCYKEFRKLKRPPQTPVESIKLNLNNNQIERLCKRLIELNVFVLNPELNILKSYLNGDKIDANLKPIEWKIKVMGMYLAYSLKLHNLTDKYEWFKWDYLFSLQGGRDSASKWKREDRKEPKDSRIIFDLIEEVKHIS